MKIKVPIFIKMFVLVIGLLFSMTFVISTKTYNLFEEVLVQREEFSNLNNSSFKGKEVEIFLNEVLQKTAIYAKKIVEEGHKITDRDILAVRIIEHEKEWVSSSPNFKVEGSLFSNKTNFPDKVLLTKINEDVVRVEFPLNQKEKSYAEVLIPTASFDLLLKNSIGSDYALTDLLGNPIWLGSGEKVEESLKTEIVKDQTVSSKQFSYKGGEDQIFAAYYKSKPLGFVLVSKTPKTLIMEPVNKARVEALHVAGKIIALSIFIIFLFSSRLTKSIRVLSEAVRKVSTGDLSVKAMDKIKGVLTDETHDLGHSFDSMTEGLKERDKVKNLMSKFHGQALTQDLLEKEIKIGGDKKEVAIFFSDIRGFTSYTEKNEAEDVVGMLNQYFESMVSVISKREGIVDKFIGDAIMAYWGVHTKGERDISEQNDAKNAVMACLEMRMALEKFNEKRIQDKKDPIQIGMGLHFGEAIAGIIGSDEKMEYTIIGDSVNMSARIEEGTKAFGSDLLVSEEIFNRVKDHFIFEKAGDVEAKGKSKPLSLYNVLGYIDQEGKEHILKTPYSSYEAKDGGKVKKTA